MVLGNPLILNAKKSMSSYQLSRDLDMNLKTAWFMLMRLDGMVESGDLLTGIVEADETYVGGKPRPVTSVTTISPLPGEWTANYPSSERLSVAGAWWPSRP